MSLNHVRIGELALAQNRLAAIVQDRVVNDELPSRVRNSILKNCIAAIANIETMRLSRRKRSPVKYNAQNKHKSAGN